MSRLTFQHLPTEVLQRCASLLDSRSLSALSLTAKSCYSIARIYLFRDITIFVDGYRGLLREIHDWDAILGRASAHKHVHRLEIEDDAAWSKRRRDKSWHRASINGFTHSSLDRDAGPLSTWSEHERLRPQFEHSHVNMHLDQSWTPLADFVRGLHALQELIYNNSDSIPACLIETLANHHPRCRLHLAKFEKCSLNRFFDHGPGLALALSPSLRSIFLKMMVQDNEHEMIEPTCIKTLLERASNLQALHIWWVPMSLLQHVDGQPTSTHNHTRPMYDQVTFDVIKSPPSSCSSLESLYLRTDLGIDEFQLGFLSLHIDFTKLRTLKLSCRISLSALSWMAAKCSLPLLNTLVLEVLVAFDGERDMGPTAYHEVLADVLLNLPPLIHLRIKGSLHERSIAAIFNRYGSTLAHLWLEAEPSSTTKNFVMTYERFNKVRLSDNPLCFLPNLTDLKLPIRRSQGNKDEVALYKLIGTLPRLRKLTLVLEIVNPSIDELKDMYLPVSSLNFDEFDQQYFSEHTRSIGVKLLNGHIKDSLINSAVDSDLARDIFEAVEQGKQANTGGANDDARRSTLESVTIIPVDGARFGSVLRIEGFDNVIRNLSRSWHVTRDTTNANKSEVEITELGKKARLEFNYLLGQKRLRGNLKLIFDRLWPRRKEDVPDGGDDNGDPDFMGDGDDENDDEWNHRWKSFPLAGVSERGDTNDARDQCVDDGEITLSD